ncbi:hypothetical protein M8J75_007151 [Diaphorina citri]|nr:hypothetical protein M8J75_007151 [Diaphorina citri]
MCANLSIADFLTQSKHLSENPSPCDTIHVVLGNESCDLDSAVSAILYAYFLVCNGDMGVLPMLNIPQKQLPIKTEVVYFLQENSICLENLIFRDSINLEQLSQSGKLKVTLVDHHVLANQDKFLKPYVIEILDHRPVSPSESWGKLERGTTMEIVGSCVTHVARKMLEHQPDLVSGNRNVANLIYGTILLDTACLSVQANRATVKDHDLIASLKRLHPDLQPESVLFQSLLDARSNISNLTSAQLMIKDLKITKQGVPIVGLPILVQDFLHKTPKLKVTLDTFLGENNASFLVLMGQTISGDTIRRDLGLYSPNSDTQLDHVISILENNQSPKLDMREIEPEENIVRLFKLTNVQVSRKQVLPLIEKAFES